MEFLSSHAAREDATGIRRALDLLLASPAVVARPKAKQWRFLVACVDRLLVPGSKSEFDDLSPASAAQLKFAVEERLRHYYMRDGRLLSHVFSLAHHSNLQMYGIDEDYPGVAGYCALVRNIADDRSEPAYIPQLRLFLERLVGEAVDAEFRAYARLPEIDPVDLCRWFNPDGSAYAEVMTVCERHRDRGWTIRNRWNPSTKRLLNLKVVTLGIEESTVRTTEYWYLRWWDTHREHYTYPYRETTRQMYVAQPSGGEWKVWEVVRPAPRSSIPYRRIKSEKRK